MTYSARGVFAFGLLALSLGGAGCKQGIGDRCQLDSDCQDGLTCVLPAGQSLAVGGTCEGPVDGSVGFDLAVPAADSAVTGSDLSAPTGDMAMPDMAVPDMAVPGDLTPTSDLTARPADAATPDGQNAG